MKNIFPLLSFLSLIGAVTAVGCGTTAKPTPAATVSPVVITVIVTATPPPGSPTPESTITPAATLTTTTGLTGTQTLVASKATNTPGAPRPTATRRPATQVAAATATASPLPMKYGAVRLQRPIYEGPNPGDQRDERHYPSDALSFEWLTNSALAGGECYEIRVDLKSNADGSMVGDSFIQCDPAETQKGGGQTIRFVLNKPNGPGPTYAALIPSGAGDLTVSWSVTIVKDGEVIPSGGSYAVDGRRHRVFPISPRSQIVSFPLKGAAP